MGVLGRANSVGGGAPHTRGLIMSNSMANRRRSNNEMDVLESVSELNPLKHALFAVPGL